MPCSPNAIASVTGKWLATGSASEPSGSAFGQGGTRVRINREPVPILCSSIPEHILDWWSETDGSTEPLNSIMEEVSPRILALNDLGSRG
jgi:hypothetical protein